MRERAFGTEPTASENLARALVGIMTATIVLFVYQRVVSPGALPDEHDPDLLADGKRDRFGQLAHRPVVLSGYGLHTA